MRKRAFGGHRPRWKANVKNYMLRIMGCEYFKWA
jgi:hypothetical protein